jgi:hypothetical protein
VGVGVQQGKHGQLSLRLGKRAQRGGEPAQPFVVVVDEGLLERRPYHEAGQRRREDYHLTAKGEDLFPAILALKQWGDRWVRTDGGRLATTHADCGSPVTVELRCADGHRVSVDGIEASRRHR